MNPEQNSQNNFFQGDDQTDSVHNGPMISGLPDNFQTPQNTPYMTQPENGAFENDQVQQVVDPFVPPEKTPISTPTAQQDYDEAAESSLEQEIANWRSKDLIIGEKNKTWYIIFTVVVLALVAISWLIGSWSFALLIIVSALALVVVRRQSVSQTVAYSLSNRGFYIDGKLHEFNLFKSFGVLKDGDEFSIIFIPRKRLSPSVSIYFPESDGEKIVDIIGSRLPMEDVKLDVLDKIVRKLKL